MEASELNLLREELHEEQDAVTAAWITRALALLETAADSDPLGPALEAEAAAAAARGDWRQAGVLWQRCRRPLPPPPEELVDGLKRPGWW